MELFRLKAMNRGNIGNNVIGGKIKKWGRKTKYQIHAAERRPQNVENVIIQAIYIAQVKRLLENSKNMFYHLEVTTH